MIFSNLNLIIFKIYKIVKISKNAFGNNKPDRDLFMTENHTILANWQLMPISYFVNDNTIKIVENRTDVYNIMVCWRIYFISTGDC